MSEQEVAKKGELKPGHIALAVLFTILVISLFCAANHYDGIAKARREEIESVRQDSLAYDEENAAYLSGLVDEMNDCQRQDEKEYTKHHCKERGEELQKKRDALEKHRIEHNYRIEKLWPSK